jgi:ActR/RegA family two-component response regulator
MPETILIVDDEESVRRTFVDWLNRSDLGVQVLSAVDAESALRLAGQHGIDLAVLDWNLGAGIDGLQLLADLVVFNPEVVAILVTGFAHQATPLEALRMGVRDYLDKSHDLNRESFLGAVRRQLDHIHPAKQQRRTVEVLRSFREAVEKVLPLVQSAAAMNDPVPLPDAIGGLFRFLLKTTGARDGALLVRHAGPDGESCRVYDPQGRPVVGELVPFGRSLAAGVVGLQEPAVMNGLESAGVLELHPFERGRSSVLAAPLNVGGGVQVVLELFDKPAGGFTDDDRRLAAVAADLGADILRHALAGHQTHRLLLDAVSAALTTSDTLAQSLRGTAAERLEQPPPEAVLERLRAGLDAAPGNLADAELVLRLAEAVRVLALRHGEPAVRHCIRLVEGLRELLDQVSGADL